MTCEQGLLRLLWGGARSWSATALLATTKPLRDLKVVSDAHISVHGFEKYDEIIRHKLCSKHLIKYCITKKQYEW